MDMHVAPIESNIDYSVVVSYSKVQKVFLFAKTQKKLIVIMYYLSEIIKSCTRTRKGLKLRA